MGRPRKEINQEQFETLCKIQCTLDEIADVFQCSEDTIRRWVKRTYEPEDDEEKITFESVYKKFASVGKSSLRRMQFRSAENGSVTMQIWLGKQYLGQKDIQDVAITNTDAQNQFAEVLDMWKDEVGQ